MGSTLKLLLVKYKIKSKLRRYKNRYATAAIKEVEAIMVGVALGSLGTPYHIKGNTKHVYQLGAIFADCDWLVHGYHYPPSMGNRAVLVVKPTEALQ